MFQMTELFNNIFCNDEVNMNLVDHPLKQL